ncbi:MAG: glutamate-5-semialdehyde dehydrogenase [Chloroflexi bacterium]|nr:MAG: glutamate-5-semialdehyde dehydrogenase [Chloroflexota bacterium]
MTIEVSEVGAKGTAARAASRTLARLSTAVKDQALLGIARDLLEHESYILSANREDMDAGRTAGLSNAVLDRLFLSHERLEAIANDVRKVSLLPDPIGEMIDMRTLPNGLRVGRRRVPLGVIAAIFESRPNVTVDIASLCLKSGNACILRGGKEAIHSNTALASIVREAISSAGGPPNAVQLIENTDRALLGELLRMRDTIDLVVPRGGAELIQYVAANATMPVLTGGTGVCHTYVDRAANIEKAVRVVHNAKTRKYSICNALDTVLVHQDIAESFLPDIGRKWRHAGVEMRCDEDSFRILHAAEIPELKLERAAPDDFGHEFLALAASVKVVDSLDGALEHIARYGTGHSDAIITEDYSAAMRFLDEVDAAVVYVNASTQFTDGAQFGLGAEIIDSTQKTIARGPVGLREITTYKWIALGDGQIRP